MEKTYLPKIARIESCIKCQLKCKCCKIKEFYDENPPKTYYLSANNFKKFIKKNPFIKIVELSNNGEMFLNPELKDIIITANKNKVVLTARTGVNFNYASDDVLEAMVKYKFHSMNVAIDCTGRHIVDANKNVFSLDGNIFATLSTATFSGTNNLYLFAYNSAGTAKNITSMDLYSCKIYDNDVLVRDFIPVIDSYNVACLYDKVERKYYYNKGTGTFIAMAKNYTPINCIGFTGG